MRWDKAAGLRLCLYSMLTLFWYIALVAFGSGTCDLVHSDVMSVLCYLTVVVFVLAHAGRKIAGISYGRLRVRLSPLWSLCRTMRLMHLECRCVALLIFDCAVPEMGVVSSQSSTGRFDEFDVS